MSQTKDPKKEEKIHWIAIVFGTAYTIVYCRIFHWETDWMDRMKSQPNSLCTGICDPIDAPNEKMHTVCSVLNSMIGRTIKISFFRIVSSSFCFFHTVRFKEDSKYKRNDSRWKNGWSTTARTLRTRARYKWSDVKVWNKKTKIEQMIFLLKDKYVSVDTPERSRKTNFVFNVVQANADVAIR